MGLTGFTADEAEAVWAWAEQVRIRSALLDFALMGSVSSVVREDGELVFHQADNAKQPAKKLK